MLWKQDWQAARANLVRWWARKGMALCLLAPRRVARAAPPAPPRPADQHRAWTDPAYRLAAAEAQMAGTWYAAEAFPYFDTQIGPGSLGLFLGAGPGYEPTTVWYEPCLSDAHVLADRPLRLPRPGNRCWEEHLALIDLGVARAQDRYLVGLPDLIENLDTLAALRGNEEILCDLVERPAWVERRIADINQAFFEAFEIMAARVRGPEGGNAFAAFRLWGPGRTAKVQCDAACMLSEAMFRRFVVPSLAAQCDWLDYAMFHLDGINALHQLDPLLEIEGLDAIQWTPQAGRPDGGSPHWYELYRRILRGGKSVQASVRPEQVVPLLDAVGPAGMFLIVGAPDEAAATALLERVEPYRRQCGNVATAPCCDP